jgi:hypothetical protein
MVKRKVVKKKTLSPTANKVSPPVKGRLVQHYTSKKQEPVGERVVVVPTVDERRRVDISQMKGHAVRNVETAI